MKDASSKKREKYEHFLEKVKILESIEPYERSVLCDALQEQNFKAGDMIIQQGTEGNTFFLIESGEAVATKAINL